MIGDEIPAFCFIVGAEHRALFIKFKPIGFFIELLTRIAPYAYFGGYVFHIVIAAVRYRDFAVDVVGVGKYRVSVVRAYADYGNVQPYYLADGRSRNIARDIFIVPRGAFDAVAPADELIS